MSSTSPLGPCEQMRLHWLSLLKEIRCQRMPHLVFHLRGIIRAAKQLLAHASWRQLRVQFTAVFGSRQTRHAGVRIAKQ